MELSGKIAIITGGGRGIGRGIADRFLQEGASVAVVQRSDLDPELRGHPRAFGVRADLSDASAFPSVVERVASRFGGIDIVVNNAGLMFERSLEDVTEADWDRMISVNLQAPLFLCKAVLPHFRVRGGGSIVNIGSIEGIGSNPQHTLYSTTKAGLHGMTRALAVDLGPEAIRCNAIAPGWISTDLSEAYLESMPDPVSARQDLASIHPLRKVGQSTDVGSLAVFLASDRAQFITGQVFVVDGGRLAQLSLPR
ncbi:MAG TPA: glucose 1-dehydrogenase [Sinomonas sp.]|nr:glucose 1-dehydrogenase [Sinomonas sp.]